MCLSLMCTERSVLAALMTDTAAPAAGREGFPCAAGRCAAPRRPSPAPAADRQGFPQVRRTGWPIVGGVWFACGMAILWALMALLMLSFVLLPALRRRRGMIEQVPPEHPDAADPADYGFVRQEELDIRMPGPDQDLLDVLDLVQRTQDYRAAAQLLAGTDTEGELRWQRVQAFAGAAALELQQRPGGVHETPGGQWLRVWRLEHPKGAGGAAGDAGVLGEEAGGTSTRGGGGVRVILGGGRGGWGQAGLVPPREP